MRMKSIVGKTTGILVILLLLFTGLPASGSVISSGDSLIPILSMEVSRQDPAVIGEEFTIVYLIKNISDKPAFKVEYSFNVVGVGESQYQPFTLTGPPAMIEQLAPGASATMPVKFTIDREAREREYQINGRITCYDATQTTQMSFFALSYVPISYTTVKPNLTVTSLTILEENPNVKEGFTVRLGLKNSSVVYDLRNILLQLEGGENFEIMEITNKKEISRISPNQTATIDFKLRARENRRSNTLGLTTSYQFAFGSVDDNREELFLPIKEEEPSTGGRRPHVIIKRYSLSKDQVLAGDRIDLTLEIENTNDRPVKNVLINFGVESTSSNGGGASSSTVFAPVGSSNTFHVEEIRGRATITNTITFAVDSSALARTYVVPVTITYEDEQGQFDNLSTRDNVNIPVTQMAKLSVTSMTLPAHATVGMPTPVMAEFVNSGKVELADFTIRLEGPFDMMDSTLYRANLGIGMTISYTGMLIAAEEGEAEGRLIVSYIDGNNQEVDEEFPFTVNIMPMEDWGDGRFPEDGMFPPDTGWMPEEPGNPVLRFMQQNWLPLALGVLIFLLLIYIVRLKKKAKEAFFDE